MNHMRLNGCADKWLWQAFWNRMANRSDAARQRSAVYRALITSAPEGYKAKEVFKKPPRKQRPLGETMTGLNTHRVSPKRQDQDFGG